MIPPEISEQPIEWEYRGWRFGGWLRGGKTIKSTQEVVVAFHGFDRSAREMFNFSPLFEDDSVMLSISLLHHDKSTPLPPLPLDEALEPSILIDGIENFISMNFSTIKKVKLVLLGYSMGSRVALTLFEKFPYKLSKVIVLAPDGLKMGGLYRFVVNTRLGKYFWRLIDKKPKTNRWFINAMRSVKLISKHKHQFGRYHTDSVQIRKRVAFGWAGHKLFWPEKEGLVKAINENITHDKKIYFIFGKRDKIIPYTWSKSLRDAISKSTTGVYFLKVSSGHVMRHASIVQEIKRAIKDAK
jgi:pimeloyl-ACP methyl ester carboxylesterase